MTIEELNKMIQEELKAYLNEEQTDEAYMEDGDDDVKVTTDEPAAQTGEEALDLLRQIYDMIKPQVEDEDETEDEPADDEGEDEPEMDDAEEAEEEEEGDAEPDEEDLEEMISEVEGGPNAAELITLLASIGIPLVLLQKDNGVNLLKRVLAKPKGRQKLAALKSWFASRDTDAAAKGDDVEEAVGYANYTADQVSKVKADAEDVNKGLNESVERFKKLTNIKG